MADWTDGPEYAPHWRPHGFVAPPVAPLDAPADALPPAATATPCAAPPSYTSPDAPALAALVQPPPQPRDPQHAFDVTASTMTPWAAGPDEAGKDHERRPEDPFPYSAPIIASVAPPPVRPPQMDDWPPPPPQPPFAPQDYPAHPGFSAPAPWQPQPQPTRPVDMSAILQACTPGVLICLALGLLVQPLSSAMFLVAWALSTRIRYRRRVLARTFLVIACGVIAVSFLGMLASQGELSLFLLLAYGNNWSPLAHLILLIAVPVNVGQALSRGEPPQDPS